MDFGYAFDSLIWDTDLKSLAPGLDAQLASLIAEAIRMDILPVKYLNDAEILVPNSCNEE